ncbi:MAG: AmmeMemoRadiSam system protein B [Candidatus Rokuibacteriota bacterium]
MPERDTGERPRLRSLEAFPVEHEGQRMIGLRDPAGFTEEVVLLPIPLLDLVSLFDGEHSVPEIQSLLERRHGQAPSADQIAGIVDRLDAGGFLDSSAFDRRLQAIEETFRRSRVRPAAHAGGAYAGDPQGLAAQIDGFFAHADGPGPGRPSGACAPRGLVAPHIDFHRGGPTYAWAYRPLTDAAEAPDLFVILGTCHAGMADPFAVTLKSYDTPLGPVAVDHPFVEDLGRRFRGDLLASEGAHRAEHSIEFQAVMLQHLYGTRRPFTIVPVLASFLHEAVWTGRDPEADRRVPRFVDALLETMAASPRRICLVAGVDLAHVGPRFGDREPNSAGGLRAVEAADRSMLDAVMDGDVTAFYTGVAADGDARRICGLSPLYTFLRALPGVRGRLLRYSQWPDPEGAVTFCAAAFP